MTLGKTNITFAPKSNSSITLLPYPYIGFVKNNQDPQNMGRLGVWIPELCGDALDEGSWIICTYCSPYAGATNITELENYQDPNTQIISQQSYGWVGVPPDINVEVMVVFACGDISRAYWTGCVYQQNMNHMVPGIPADTTWSGQQDNDGTTLGTVVPVMEYNKAGVTGTPSNVNRPVFQPLTTGLDRQGLVNDLERGVSSTGMRRETPPLMSGWLSPRGSTLHIDDAATNEFIRLRTRSGAQILIHETTGYVYINSVNGNSWFEIAENGINGFTSSTLSLRSMGDINLISGGNINLDAVNVNIRAKSQINLSATTIQIGASGALTMSAGTNINSAAAGIWARSGSTIQDNAGTVPPATPPASTTVSDTTSVQTGNNRAIWTYGASSINSIASVVPTHEPWPGHSNAMIPPIPVTDNVINAPGNGVSPSSESGSAGGSGGGSGGSGGSGSSGTPPATDGCSFGVAHTKPISTIVFNAIQTAASKTGAPFATMLAFADIESSFNPNAGARTSNAQGLFQFIPSTWSEMVTKYGNKYGVPVTAGSVLDPNYNSLMGGQFLQDNAAKLTAKGLAVTPGNLYIMHFIGSNGGPGFIQQATGSQSGANATSLYPGAARSNSTIFYGKTMGQVYAYLIDIANSRANAYATQTGSPAPCTKVTGQPGNVSKQISQATPTAAATSAQSLTGKWYWAGGSGTEATVSQKQCVALLRSSILNYPSSTVWRKGQGDLVNNPPNPGTGIATFVGNGGTSYIGIPGAGTTHAAIYLGPATTTTGIKVLEQYGPGKNNPVGQPAHIKDYKAGDPRGGEYDANNYHVIVY